MNTKNIIISVTNDISYDQRMLKTAISLVKCGFDIIIVGRKLQNTKEVNLQGIKTFRFNLIFNKGKLFYLEYNLRLLVFLLFQKIDILCAVDLDTIVPNVLISKLRNKMLIYDAHEYFTEVPELVGRNFEKKIWKSIEKWAIPKCNKMYTVAPLIANLFNKEYSTKCDVIYNYPLSQIQNTNPNPNSTKIILYQGDLNEGRGLENAILAMKNIPAELWIAGDGEIYKSLEIIIEQNLLKSKVKLLGKVTPVELKNITSNAFIGLNLLENKGLNYYYSLANKFFDYIQHSVPSINMNFPEYQSIVNQYKCALLIENIEVKTIENALLNILNDENLYSQLRNNCDIARSYLQWEIQEEKLCSIYKND